MLFKLNNLGNSYKFRCNCNSLILIIMNYAINFKWDSDGIVFYGLILNEHPMKFQHIYVTGMFVVVQ